MGVGTQCRRSLSPFPVGLLPPKIGCGVFGVVCLVWCVCATGGGPQYRKMYWFPLWFADFDRKNRMPLILETKQDENGKNTLFVESVCCMVPIACNLIDSAYGLKNLVNMQILTFHHTV